MSKFLTRLPIITITYYSLIALIVWLLPCSHMSELAVGIVGMLVAAAIVGFPVWILIGWLPMSIDREYERRRIYGDDEPVFNLKGGVLVIDWKTFGLSSTKRFFVRQFPKVAIILGSGKELYFYKGIRGKMFTYEGKLSILDELQYDNIKEYIK